MNNDKHSQSRISLGRYEFRKAAREKPLLPIIEKINEADRFTWDDGVILAQIEIEKGHEIEWYARNRRTLESEAGVGFQSLERFKYWLGLQKRHAEHPDVINDILHPKFFGYNRMVGETLEPSSQAAFIASLPFKFALEHYNPKF